MGYCQPPEARIVWDRPSRWQGVTIKREINGELYAWKIPWNGVVPQAMAAGLLRVSTMAINNWVREREDAAHQTARPDIGDSPEGGQADQRPPCRWQSSSAELGMDTPT